MAIEHTIHFMMAHGYAVVFTWVLLDLAGVPIPSVPILLGAGALTATDHMRVGLVLGTAAAAALTSDLLWYVLGRTQGVAVLHLLCRIALEPDSCVRQTQELFTRRGTSALLVAKFVPGLGTVAIPLAGIIRMPVARFVLFDGLGIFLWVSVYVTLGRLFADQLAGVAAMVATLGVWVVVVVLGGVATYLLWKLVVRRRLLRELRVARISPEELKHELETGEGTIVVDLRHALDMEAEPVTIPGAVRWAVEDLSEQVVATLRDRAVVLYCS